MQSAAPSGAALFCVLCRKCLDRTISTYDNLYMPTTTATLTASDIEAGYDDERWLGHGYLGERSHMVNDLGIDAPAAADAALIEVANAKGWDYERLFLFLNSKPGRWFGDMTFGSDDDPAKAATLCTGYKL